MRSRIKSLFAALTVIQALLIPVSAQAFDSTPPKLNYAALSTMTLPETGGTVVVTAQVTAAAYGLEQTPFIVFQMDGNTKTFSCTRPGMLRMTLVSGDEKNGTYRCEVDFVEPLRPGIYRLTIFPLTDKGGNTTSGFINTGQSISVGLYATTQTTPAPVVTPVPTAAPAPTAAPITVPSPAVTMAPQKTTSNDSQIANLEAQINKLASLVTSLNLKLKKICSAKPKPKGC